MQFQQISEILDELISSTSDNHDSRRHPDGGQHNITDWEEIAVHLPSSTYKSSEMRATGYHCD